MSRPTYETAEDKHNERRAAQWLKGAYKDHEVHLLKKYYPCDILVISPNGKTTFVEYKRRNISADRYKTAIFPAIKWSEIKRMAESLDSQAAIMFEYNDCYMTSMQGFSYKISVGGRRDRNDTQDIEPLLEIPTHQFIRHEKKS